MASINADSDNESVYTMMTTVTTNSVQTRHPSYAAVTMKVIQNNNHQNHNTEVPSTPEEKKVTILSKFSLKFFLICFVIDYRKRSEDY